MRSTEINTVRLGLLTKKYQDVLRPFLDEVGISPDIFHDPEYDCPLAKHVELFEIAARKLNRPSLGLNCGKQLLSSDFGLMGQAIRSQETIGDMISWIEKYMVIHQQATSVSHQLYDGKLAICYQIDDPAIINKRQDSEFSLALTHALVLELTEEKPSPIRVDFSHEKPVNIEEHLDFFKCPVHFNQPKNRIVYKAHLFNSKLETCNYAILNALKSYIEELHKLRSPTSTFITQMDIVISRQLGNGGTNLPRVASEMAMSARTLQRRLADLDIHFGDHVEDLKQSIALHYIVDEKFSLTEIALFLGYSEASSFSRAFKRWTGLTPGQYRKKQAGSD